MEIKYEAWTNFMETFDYESDVSQFKYDFQCMTKNFGVAYMEYCKAAWSVNHGVMTEEEFMRFNGNMPKGFFDKKIRGCEGNGKA